jgi:hypothetical protein
MTPELDRYYTNRLSMMGDEAWNDLMIDVREMLDATNRLNGVDSEKTLWFKKGEISIMNWLLSQKEITEAAYEDLLNEDKNANVA